VGIRFELFEESFCFVCTHLAAGQKDVKARNENYKTILETLTFPVHPSKTAKMMDHTKVWWIGDLNYRIDMSNDQVRTNVQRECWDRLYVKDQLYTARQSGAAFEESYNWKEGRLAFAPTYKYDTGTTIYDSSKKNRSPAWCDRVLWRGEDIEQHSYSRDELMQSDHRPVTADFIVGLNVVGEVSMPPSGTLAGPAPSGMPPSDPFGDAPPDDPFSSAAPQEGPGVEDPFATARGRGPSDPFGAPPPKQAQPASADPFAAPSTPASVPDDPFSAPAAAPAALDDPFGAPVGPPPIAAQALTPDDPFGAPASAPAAPAPDDPFGAPAASAPDDPFGAPAASATPDDPFGAPPAPVASAQDDPFAAPAPAFGSPKSPFGAAPVASPKSSPFGAPVRGGSDPFGAPPAASGSSDTNLDEFFM